jgi:hypothetical protein
MTHLSSTMQKTPVRRFCGHPQGSNNQAKLDTLGNQATLSPGTDAQLATPLESECVTSQVGFGH